MKLNIKNITLGSAMAFALFATGCQKEFFETKPSEDVGTEEITSSTKGLYTLLNGLHYQFVKPGASGDGRAYDWGQKSIDMALDIMGEDVVVAVSGYDWFTYHAQYVSTEAANYWMPYHVWRFYYTLINNANQILDAVDAASGPSNEKDDIRSQALTYRAFAYLKLVNCFSDHILSPNGPNAMGVPIYTVATNGDTKFPGRGTVADVYARIFQDLDDAELGFYTSGVGNFPPNKSYISIDVYNGIYARAALTAGRYDVALSKANAARAGTSPMTRSQLLEGFNSSVSTEWIWASYLTAEQSNARSLLCFMSWMDEATPGYANAGATRSISETLWKLMEVNDVRREQFDTLNFYKQKKFGVLDKTGFVYNDLYMRGSEMLLIEAECQARLGNTAAATALLQEMMSVRSNTYDVATAIASRNNGDVLTDGIAKQLLGMEASETWTILEEVKLQRKIELWGEGFGYDDVRRYQKGLHRPRNFIRDHSSSGVGGLFELDANAREFLFRIPQRELDANVNMVQNP